jgi:hypothetical protein
MVENKKYVVVKEIDRTTYYEAPINDPIVTAYAMASVLVRPTIQNSDIQRGIEKIFRGEDK